jgi:hypothetical protein
MSSKSSISLNKIRGNMYLGTPHKKKRKRETPTSRTKDRENMDNLRITSPSYKQIRTLERQRNILGSGATSIISPGITLLIAAQSSRWWLR